MSATLRDCALSTISVSRALCRPGVKVGIYIFVYNKLLYLKKKLHVESNNLTFDLLDESSQIDVIK